MSSEIKHQAGDALNSLSDFELCREIWASRKRVVVLDVKDNERADTMSFLVLLGVVVMVWKDDETWAGYKRLRHEKGLPEVSRPTTFEQSMLQFWQDSSV